MAKATVNTKIDGHTYRVGENLPDLGTINCMSVTNGNVRSYEGLSKDIAKLPKYDDLGDGSSCLFRDTAQLFKYTKSTKTWAEVGSAE